MILEIEVGTRFFSLIQTALGAYLIREGIRAIMIIVITRSKKSPEFEDEDELEMIV